MFSTLEFSLSSSCMYTWQVVSDKWIEVVTELVNEVVTEVVNEVVNVAGR